MGEIAKAFQVFVCDWLLMLLFFLSSALVFIGYALQNLLKTPTFPANSIFVDIALISLISHFLNKKFIKARMSTFIIVQLLFGACVVGVLFLIAQSLTHLDILL